MTTRRSFLKLLGIAPVAGKNAAKAAVGRMLPELAPLSTTVPRALVGSDDSPAWRMDHEDDDDPVKLSDAVAKLALQPSLPDWFLEERWERSRNGTILDPDIASFKSWSLSAKIAAQRDRDYKRELGEFRSNASRALTRAIYRKANPWFKWW